MIPVALAVLAFAAAPDPDWPYPPAWTGTVLDVRRLPMGVCPYGVASHAAYRGTRRLDRQVFITGSRWVVNRYRLRLRVYVWCG